MKQKSPIRKISPKRVAELFKEDLCKRVVCKRAGGIWHTRGYYIYYLNGDRVLIPRGKCIGARCENIKPDGKRCNAVDNWRGAKHEPKRRGQGADPTNPSECQWFCGACHNIDGHNVREV